MASSSSTIPSCPSSRTLSTRITFHLLFQCNTLLTTLTALEHVSSLYRCCCYWLILFIFPQQFNSSSLTIIHIELPIIGCWPVVHRSSRSNFSAEIEAIGNFHRHYKRSSECTQSSPPFYLSFLFLLDACSFLPFKRERRERENRRAKLTIDRRRSSSLVGFGWNSLQLNFFFLSFFFVLFFLISFFVFLLFLFCYIYIYIYMFDIIFLSLKINKKHGLFSSPSNTRTTWTALHVNGHVMSATTFSQLANELNQLNWITLQIFKPGQLEPVSLFYLSGFQFVHCWLIQSIGKSFDTVNRNWARSNATISWLERLNVSNSQLTDYLQLMEPSSFPVWLSGMNIWSWSAALSVAWYSDQLIRSGEYLQRPSSLRLHHDCLESRTKFAE